MASYINCVGVSDECPISATAYGYAPSLAANATLLAIFSIITIAQMIQGVKYHTWGFTTAFMLGGFFEILGYAGRIMMASNPWNQAG